MKSSSVGSLRDSKIQSNTIRKKWNHISVISWIFINDVKMWFKEIKKINMLIIQDFIII